MFKALLALILTALQFAARGVFACSLMPDSDGYYTIDGQKYTPDFFAYNIDFDTAGANSNIAGVAATTVNGQFIVQAGQWFLWQQACYWADTAHATLTDSTRLLPLCTVFLSDANSGKNLMDSASAVPSLFGTAQQPFVLPNPRLFAPQSVCRAQVINMSTVAYNLRLCFIGLALYPSAR